MNKRHAGWMMVFAGAAGLLTGPAIAGLLRREAIYLGLADAAPGGEGATFLIIICSILAMVGAIAATANYFDI